MNRVAGSERDPPVLMTFAAILFDPLNHRFSLTQEVHEGHGGGSMASHRCRVMWRSCMPG